jgi:hypothetical protein
MKTDQKNEMRLTFDVSSSSILNFEVSINVKQHSIQEQFMIAHVYSQELCTISSTRYEARIE